MKIDSIQINGFGLFANSKEIDFSPGINLVYGSNEAGKSTILNFIIAMLYGMKEEDRQSRKWLPEHGKYRPWNLKDYGGKITITTDKSDKYSVIRDFVEDADAIRIFDEVTGKELTTDFEMDKTKERQFARKITGLSRSFFLSSVCIKQLGSIIGGEDAKTIASYAQSLIDTGGSDITAAKAIEILGAEVETIGKTERGKVFKRLRDKQDELINALAKNDGQQSEIRNARDAHSKKSTDLKFLSEKLRGFRSVLLNGWIEKAEKKLKRVTELLSENKQFSDKLDSADLLKDFSDKQKDSVIRLETELKQRQDQQSKLNEQLQEINTLLKNIRGEISARKQFAKVSAEELEQFSLNERRWRDLREDNKNKTRQLKAEEFEDEQTTRRLRRLELVFAKLPPHIDQVYLNWERKLSEFKTSIIQENSLRQSMRKMLKHLRIRVALLALALGAFIYYVFFHSMLDDTTRYGSSGIAALLAVILLVSYGKKSGRINKDIGKCSSIIKDLEAHSAETKQKIDILFETTESKSGDEFTSKYNSFINLVSGKRHVHQEHLKEDIKNLELKIKDLENEMLNLLERAFPGIRPDKISPELTEQYVQEARKFLELSE
jgi:chromosome segregation ATPase